MFAPTPRYSASERLTRYRDAARKAKEAAREMEGVNGDLAFDLYRLAREAQSEADRIDARLQSEEVEIAHYEIKSGRSYDAWSKTASDGEIERSIGLA